MIPGHRSQSSTSSKRPSISSPIPSDRFVPLSPPRTKSPPPAAATSPPRSRSALGGSMARGWLSRNSSSASSNSAPYTPSKPIRISEPKLSSAFESFNMQRGGTLGSGAIVVRTPQEALAGTNVSMYETEHTVQTASRSEDRYEPPMSPPLPPIPDFGDNEEEEAEVREVEQAIPSRSSTPSRPTRAPPPVPLEDNARTSPPLVARRSSLKASATNSEYFPPVPALPANIPPSPPQPPFESILLSPMPTGAVDPTKVLVTLETCTTTYRTTLQTLISRPSYLSTYLKSLLVSQDRDDDDERSMRDDDSAFNSIFHHHLTSSGLLPQTSGGVHIFLDRPSAPYAHILAYLRTPNSTPEHPATLPRPVQLTSSSNSRLDALLELRDEARYLDLDELYKLCTDEIRLRYSDSHRNNALGLHTRAMSNASSVSGRSLGTLRETVERVMETSELGEMPPKHARNRSKDSGLGSGSPRSNYAKSPSPRDSDPQSNDAWNSSPPVMANATALQQRLQLSAKSRNKPAPIPRAVGRWV
ncbi:hypothetical protein QCA50_000503 [Cerrena zonata]|uniref:BTB domain-containing protein n=1 Tax=Cerrena zonata TaxID=2478898 RepID=A0AAW0GRI7_9APHY